jgi:heme/copper-type cytochrome/quinol oxidase subunit 3
LAVPSPSTPKGGRLQPAKLGILLFIVIEIMFFAGLISAFLVFRVGAEQWPPAGQPRLPLEMTAVNTFLLLLSGLTMHLSYKSLLSAKTGRFFALLVTTAVLGAVFLSVQGVEWVRLVKFGMTATANIFGGFFYALVGMHGLHVAGGLGALLFVLGRAWNKAYSAKEALGVDVCRTYWYFVVGLWPLLFTLIYF